MQRPFTGIKDVDKKILQELNDKDLFSLLLTKNIYLYKLTDDMFWKNRLIYKYPTTVQYKPEKQSYKQYYLNVVYYIDKLKKIGFIYTAKDPKFIYDFLVLRKDFATYLTENVVYVMKRGYEDVAIYLVNSIRKQIDFPLFVLGSPEWKNYINSDYYTELFE